MKFFSAAVGFVFLVAVSACGGAAAGASSTDPRCSELCKREDISMRKTGEYCNDESIKSCARKCEARISGAKSVCQTCLLEDAYFGLGARSQSGAGCVVISSKTQCSVSTELGSCSYDDNNPKEKEACLLKVDPLRPVSCTAQFESVTKCASFCGTSAN